MSFARLIVFFGCTLGLLLPVAANDQEHSQHAGQHDQRLKFRNCAGAIESSFNHNPAITAFAIWSAVRVNWVDRKD